MRYRHWFQSVLLYFICAIVEKTNCLQMLKVLYHTFQLIIFITVNTVSLSVGQKVSTKLKTIFPGKRVLTLGWGQKGHTVLKYILFKKSSSFFFLHIKKNHDCISRKTHKPVYFFFNSDTIGRVLSSERGRVKHIDCLKIFFCSAVDFEWMTNTHLHGRIELSNM